MGLSEIKRLKVTSSSLFITFSGVSSESLVFSTLTCTHLCTDQNQITSIICNTGEWIGLGFVLILFSLKWLIIYSRSVQPLQAE